MPAHRCTARLGFLISILGGKDAPGRVPNSAVLFELSSSPARAPDALVKLAVGFAFQLSHEIDLETKSLFSRIRFRLQSSLMLTYAMAVLKLRSRSADVACLRELNESH